MTTMRQLEPENTLLRLMPQPVLDRLSDDLYPVDLPFGACLTAPEEPIRHIVFPECGIASVIVEDISGRRIALGHVGREGMVGYFALLGAERTPYRTLMQVAGYGLRIDVRKAALLLDDAAVRTLLLRSVYSSELQISFTTLAAARYRLPQRLARWLLMCQDRIEGESLAFTHSGLSVLLGVRRASVTDQLHVLEGMRAIKATRGHIRILNRDTLLRMAGESYGTPESAYERLVLGSATGNLRVGHVRDVRQARAASPFLEMR